jgi:hypothetical protein
VSSELTSGALLRARGAAVRLKSGVVSCARDTLLPLTPRLPSAARYGVALAVVWAFAGGLALTLAAAAGGGEPGGTAPVGSLAVPIEHTAPFGEELTPGNADAIPLLGPAEPLPSLAAPEVEPVPSVPAPAPRPAPAPTHRRASPEAEASAIPASPPPAPAPPPAPVAPAPPSPAPAPAPAPAPDPAPDPAPPQPAPAPEPPPVEFDDSG